MIWVGPPNSDDLGPRERERRVRSQVVMLVVVDGYRAKAKS